MADETTRGNIEFDPEKASKGGFAGIEEIQGILVKHTRIPNKFGETRKKFGTDIDEVAPDQIQVDLEEVIILKMADGEEEPELTDGKFSILINYAKPGQMKSNNLSQWNSGYADSCKKVHGKLPNEVEGQLVRLAKLPVTLKMRDRQTKEVVETEAIRWQFVPLDAPGVDIDAKIKTAIEGKNKSAALRAVMQDPQLRQKAELKDAVTSGKPVAGLEVVEGVYVTTEPASGQTS